MAHHEEHIAERRHDQEAIPRKAEQRTVYDEPRRHVQCVGDEAGDLDRRPGVEVPIKWPLVVAKSHHVLQEEEVHEQRERGAEQDLDGGVGYVGFGHFRECFFTDEYVDMVLRLDPGRTRMLGRTHILRLKGLYLISLIFLWYLLDLKM